jgi:hypothetical protein
VQRHAEHVVAEAAVAGLLRCALLGGLLPLLLAPLLALAAQPVGGCCLSCVLRSRCVLGRRAPQLDGDLQHVGGCTSDTRA